jgi:hypothetical protein
MSVEAAPVERSAIPSPVRELAGELLPDAPRLAREMNEHLFAMMAELRERDECHRGFRSGETRTRTGDTTIFSRAVTDGPQARNPWKTCGSSAVERSRRSSQFAAASRRFRRWSVLHLPIRATSSTGQ